MLFITTEYLLNREVEHVLAALTPVNRLVMRCCLHTGLRVSDVLSFKTEQLKRRFWITESKTGKKKMVGLPAPLLRQLKDIAGDIYVFESRLDPRKHRTRQAVWKDVKRAADAFRLNQNVAPHSFRKVYAVRLMERYGDIKKVQRALNHGSETTTMIYAMAGELLYSKKLKQITKHGLHL